MPESLSTQPIETAGSDSLGERQRVFFVRSALSYGGSVWELIRDGYDMKDVADCAYNAWAAQQAALADAPLRRHEELWEARYGRPSPVLRLVVNNE